MPTSKRIRPLLAALLALALSSCVASRAFRDAEREEVREHWDLAVLHYQKALALEPDNTRYKIALSRARQRAAHVHYEKGKLLKSGGQLDMSAAEFETSVSLDPSNDSAVQEWRRVKNDIEARRIESAGGTPVEKAKQAARGARARPPMLSPSSTKGIDLLFPQETNIKKIYQALAISAGINVIYDPQLKDDKFTIELHDVSFQKGLETVMRQAGHFYKVIDEKTILIAQDTNQNRKEYEDLVIRTFFLSNGDIKDVSAMVRSLLDLRRLATIPQLNAIVIRDTADKVAVAERIIEVNDKAKAEVVVDVELLQLDTNKIVKIGTEFPPYLTSGTYKGSAPPSTDGSTTGTSTRLPWNELFKIGLTDFSFTVPAITFNFFKDNSDAEVLARPQLRIAEGEKAQLVIGDRVPIPVTTVNTTQAIGQVGVVPVTSFQYQEVGIKIDLEPRVHHNKEVTLKLTIEVSNLNGQVTGPNGQNQPIIGTRTLTSTIRLKDGETNILAGLLRRDTQRGKTSIPFLGDLPIIGTLFSNHSDQSKRTDLFLTLTPHIIRAPQITEEDLIPVWVGTENNVSFSGLNTRLESPTAPGSPFDSSEQPARSVPGRPGRVSPSAPQIQTPAPGTVTPQPIIQGSAPRDPFRDRTVPTTPQKPTPQPQQPDFQRSQPPSSGELLRSSPVPPPDQNTPQSLLLGLTSSTESVAPGEATVVSLSSLSSLAELGALELTVEWDPAVVEVTGVAPGPWKARDEGNSVRFESDRTMGRARLQLGRQIGAFGLPEGVLAQLAVRGVAPGTTMFRVSAGAAASRSGGIAPTVESVAVTVGQ